LLPASFYCGPGNNYCYSDHIKNPDDDNDDVRINTEGFTLLLNNTNDNTLHESDNIVTVAHHRQHIKTKTDRQKEHKSD